MRLGVPNFEQLEKWAKYKQIHWTDRAQLITLPAVQDKMERDVLGPLADLAHFEMPKNVALLQHDFLLEHGEMTPTLKVKRRVINEPYKDVIDAIYA
jgi:long-chain acyl-CoA synthetase